MNKNKNTIFSVVIILLFVGGLVLLAGPGKKETANIADSSGGGSSVLPITLTEKSFDFGTISMTKGTVFHDFKILNSAAEAFVVKKMYTSCMCTNASLITASEKVGPFGMMGHGFVPEIDVPITAGEEASVRVVFNPAAHGPAGVGRIERSVYLENNAGAPVEIKISATVTP